VSECMACDVPDAFDLIVMHAIPEAMRNLIEAINRGDVRSVNGARITVELVFDPPPSKHAMLQFTEHYE